MQLYFVPSANRIKPLPSLHGGQNLKQKDGQLSDTNVLLFFGSTFLHFFFAFLPTKLSHPVNLVLFLNLNVGSSSHIPYGTTISVGELLAAVVGLVEVVGVVVGDDDGATNTQPCDAS